METKTIELTRREKIMYYLISIILAVTTLVSMITIISQNERDYYLGTKNSLSTVTKSLSDNILKEESPQTTTNIVNITSKASSNSLGNTDWSIPDGIITQAKQGDTINIINQVTNKDGVAESASVMIRKLDGDTYRIVKTNNESFTVTTGTYKYYYTHNGITKEITLEVTEELSVNSVTASEVSTNTSEPTDKKLKLVINTNQEYQQIISKTPNIEASKEEKNIILLIDSNNLTSDTLNITLNIDNKDYQMKVKMSDIKNSNITLESTIENSTKLRKT